MENLEFRVSSGLKNLIGKELITNDIIAIFELVKNSYDAGAKNVRIVFENIKPENKENISRISIIDDGTGMSLEEIKKKWLFVGYSAKRFFTAQSHNRLVAGAKGIGRFACDRLGKLLDMYSKTCSDTVIHHIKVDWERFELDQNKEFQRIPVSYSHEKSLSKDETLLVTPFKTGTVLCISSLNGEWDDAKLVQLKRYLQRLINPAQMNSENVFKIELVAEEYISEDEIKRKKNSSLAGEHRPEVVVNGLVKNVVFENIGMKTTQIACEIDPTGKSLHTRLMDKDRCVFDIKQENEFKLLNNIKVSVFFLNQGAKATFTRAMGIEPVNYGSIFLYKNGFKVHPCGEVNDDWLGIALRQAQGQRRYLGPRNLIGRVEINGTQQTLVEVSSRDGGLIKNGSYEELVQLVVSKALRPLERFVVEGIDWGRDGLDMKDTATNRLNVVGKLAGALPEGSKVIVGDDLLKILKRNEAEKTPELIKNVESISRFISNPIQKKYLENQVVALRSVALLKERELAETKKDLEIKEKAALFLEKATQTDEFKAAVLSHTINIYTEHIDDELNDIYRKFKGVKFDALLKHLDNIRTNNSKISIISGIAGMAKFNAKASETEGDVFAYAREYLDNLRQIEHDRDRDDRRIDINLLNSEAAHTLVFKPLDISIILDNFISNSRKAKARKVFVKFEGGKTEGKLYFSDDGKGINAKYQGRIFTRGFTTTDGAGIGLHHIRDIAQSWGGDVRFVGNGIKGMGDGACFEVVFP